MIKKKKKIRKKKMDLRKEDKRPKRFAAQRAKV